MNKTAVLIPARMASTRFPGKPLVDLCGKPMIQWVYEKSCKASGVCDVVVATCDKEIFDAVSNFGGKAIMTSDSHTSGTDRIAEAAQQIDAEIIVNVQGDEPLMEPANIVLVTNRLLSDPEASMASLMFAIDGSEALDPNLVKVVVNYSGRAMYFSRSPIPNQRKPIEKTSVFGHAGIYAYHRDFLFAFSALPPTPLEQCECLEQLRALEHGHIIAMAETTDRPVGVDTVEDKQAAERLLTEQMRLE